jgi:uncharacterized protein YdbL (DUF1318 family)
MIRRILLAAALAMAAPVGAAQVSAALAAGTVGERFDGYMGVNGTVSAAVRSQVASINIQRRSLYSRLAASRGVTPQDVGVTAGCPPAAVDYRRPRS